MGRRRSRPGAGPMLALAALLAALATGPATARAQGVEGGPPGEEGGTPSPRGSAMILGESTEEFGGVGGGGGLSGGSAGAPTLGRLPGSPGDPEESKLGRPIGASGAVGGGGSPGTQGTLLGGRVGVSGPRISTARFQPPTQPRNLHPRPLAERFRSAVPDIDPITLAPNARLALPADREEPGPPGALTLDAAIGMLLARNLDLLALRFEVPKAEADVLTAGLRNNPIFFADGQLVPYGHYSYLHPGGGAQPQYDVNVSYPIDVSLKRRARLEVARAAKRVTEAQLQDAARQLVDELYTAFINLLATRETIRYGEAYLREVTIESDRAEALKRRAQAEVERLDRDAASDDDRREAQRTARAADDAADLLRDELQQTRAQVRQAVQTLGRARRELAVLLGLAPAQVDALEIRAALRELRPLPAPPDELIRLALAHRPDLAAYRLGVDRAKADVRLARANRFSDIYVVYQPYTLQSGRAYGVQGTYSYALGVNAALPVYNRNQGNIQRAQWNLRQTGAELASLENRVAHEVDQAARDVRESLAQVLNLERSVLPATVRTLGNARQQYREDASKVYDFVDALTDYREVVRQYRESLVDLRRDMLGLNTAVGLRIFP